MEAGPHTRDVLNHIQPARCFSCLRRPTETFSFHVAKPSPALCDRSLIVATGRALGGGSSVNCMEAVFMIDARTYFMEPVMFYTRAAASDYDDWENVYGNKGWGSKHLIPLLKKVGAFRSIYLETNYSFVYRRKHINHYQRILRMEMQGQSKCRSPKTPQTFPKVFCRSLRISTRIVARWMIQMSFSLVMGME